jgi:hypothetical protein
MSKQDQERDFFAIELAAVLIVLSAILYFSHYLIFRFPPHLPYLVGDIAFLPIEVLL